MEREKHVESLMKSYRYNCGRIKQHTRRQEKRDRANKHSTLSSVVGERGTTVPCLDRPFPSQRTPGEVVPPSHGAGQEVAHEGEAQQERTHEFGHIFLTDDFAKIATELYRELREAGVFLTDHETILVLCEKKTLNDRSSEPLTRVRHNKVSLIDFSTEVNQHFSLSHDTTRHCTTLHDTAFEQHKMSTTEEDT